MALDPGTYKAKQKLPKDIYEAIFNLQSEIGAIPKNASNPFHKSKYATLDAIWDTLHPLLQKHGLLVLQPIEVGAQGTVKVVTVIRHLGSGTQVSSEIEMPLVKMDPQAAGSAITYSRRYGISSLLSLQTDSDDDGNAASGVAGKKPKPAPRSKPEPEKEEELSPLDVAREFVAGVETIDGLKEFYNKNSKNFKGKDLAAFKAILSDRKAEIEEGE